MNGLLHLLSPRQMRPANQLRLVQTLLVRDEADAIADNLRIHASLGVDAFVVMDNGSVDGTREVLEELRDELEIRIVDRPGPAYQQSAWKTELAFLARDVWRADWSFNADADEIWLPDGDSLKEGLGLRGSVVSCPRSNYLHDQRLLQDPARRWFQADLRVQCPVVQAGVDVQREPRVHLLLSTIKPKVMVNAYGLLRVKGGNHRAVHARCWGTPPTHPHIRIAHFPLRSWEHFSRHVRRRVELLDSGESRMGLHYKRWAEQCRRG